MGKKRVVAKQKGRKKNWYRVALPSILKNGIIGEALAAEPDDLIGRTVNTSLRGVLGPNYRHMNVKLVINDVKNAVAQTIINTINVDESYLYRKTRKNSKICTKWTGETKDGSSVSLRICAITYGFALSTVKKELRKELTNLMNDKIKKLKKDELINNLLNTGLQKDFKKVLHKIHPMKSVELEKLRIEQHLTREE